MPLGSSPNFKAKSPNGIPAPCSLDIKPEMHDVAVLDDVFAALETHLPMILRAVLAVAGDEVRICDHFGANEPLLEIGVDDARGFRGRVAVMDRPRADFLWPHGEVGFEPE